MERTFGIANEFHVTRGVLEDSGEPETTVSVHTTLADAWQALRMCRVRETHDRRKPATPSQDDPSLYGLVLVVDGTDCHWLVRNSEEA